MIYLFRKIAVTAWRETGFKDLGRTTCPLWDLLDPHMARTGSHMAPKGPHMTPKASQMTPKASQMVSKGRPRYLRPSFWLHFPSIWGTFSIDFGQISDRFCHLFRTFIHYSMHPSNLIHPSALISGPCRPMARPGGMRGAVKSAAPRPEGAGRARQIISILIISSPRSPARSASPTITHCKIHPKSHPKSTSVFDSRFVYLILEAKVIPNGAQERS